MKITLQLPEKDLSYITELVLTQPIQSLFPLLRELITKVTNNVYGPNDLITFDIEASDLMLVVSQLGLRMQALSGTVNDEIVQSITQQIESKLSAEKAKDPELQNIDLLTALSRVEHFLDSVENTRDDYVNDKIDIGRKFLKGQ